MSYPLASEEYREHLHKKNDKTTCKQVQKGTSPTNTIDLEKENLGAGPQHKSILLHIDDVYTPHRTTSES
jgi:hypothetical protein